MNREMIIKGIWYDGAASKAVPARARLDDQGRLVVEGEGGQTLARQAFRQVRVSDRLGQTPRFLTFEDNGRFETGDNRAVDRLVVQVSGRRTLSLMIHGLQSRWPYILAALALAGLLVWAAVGYGLPWAARIIAGKLPPTIYAQVDGQALAVMDRVALSPSQLEDEIQDRLRERFRPILEDHSGLGLKVIFRQGGRLGANAFALPGGTIIFTDEMVKLSRNDDQLAAVLAHEIGHVALRHAMRSLIQSSALSLMILALTGDVSGTSEIFLGLPVLLTDRHYSRDFERQADGFALAYLNRAGIATRHFADLMRLVDKESEGLEGPVKERWRDYLSSHPKTEDRLKAFED